MSMEHHSMGMEHHRMEMDPGMMMMWEKADDETKKMLKLRMLDWKIMHKENCIKELQYKVETMKMIREKMGKA